MDRLSEFTTDELKDELKRRQKENIWSEFTAVIKAVNNKHVYRKGFNAWTFEVHHACVNGVEVDSYYHNSRFKLKKGAFNRENAPKIGDKVLLRYRNTRKNRKFKEMDVMKARIIEIIKDNHQ